MRMHRPSKTGHRDQNFFQIILSRSRNEDVFVMATKNPSQKVVKKNLKFRLKLRKYKIYLHNKSELTPLRNRKTKNRYSSFSPSVKCAFSNENAGCVLL